VGETDLAPGFVPDRQRARAGFGPWQIVDFCKDTAIMIAVSCNPSRPIPAHC